MKKAFTLLEVIIVIIIIGVLASLALPRLFAVVESARATEALSAITSIRSALERRYLMNNGTYSKSLAILLFTDTRHNMLDIEDPGFSPNAHFLYSVVAGTHSQGPWYYIVAYRNARDNGDSNQFLFLTYNEGTTVQSFGGGAFTVTAGTRGTNELVWGATEVYKGVIPK